MDERLQALRQRVKDDDVSYNTFGEEENQRPWALELLPFLISSKDCEAIEAGVLQRTELLNRIMADIYGEQQLLKEGLLPAALVQGHPEYMPSMQGVQPAGQHFIHMAAFDIARDADGNWWVVSQRLQSPFGLGYMLENRHLVAQQFPNAFSQLHVRQLATAYKALLSHLRQLSGAGDQAHVALLTAGASDSTWFEHAYLARHLGISLVEGNDLTVRNQRLYLKTLQGLEPVHVLLKRMGDAYLDPLELNPDAMEGVPGLMQAVRAGNVVMANAPGTGFLESSALLGFLPALAQRLMGQELLIPALHTWWCGEAAVLPQVQVALKDCVIKPTYPAHLMVRPPERELAQPVLTRHLGKEDRAQWLDRLAREGAYYTVQRRMPPSVMPVWSEGAEEEHGRLELHPGILRVFCFSDAKHGWRVVPGGMAQVLDDHSGLSDMRWGGSSADVWVLSHASTSSHSSAAVMQPTRAPGAPAPLRGWMVTSTAADNLFWYGRYVERIEVAANLITKVMAVLEGEKTPSQETWQWLDGLLRWQGLIGDDAPSLAHNTQACLDVLMRNVCCTDGSAVLGNNLRNMRQTASRVRDRLASQHWQETRLAHEEFVQESMRLLRRNRATPIYVERMLQRLQYRLSAITGAMLDRMTRDDGWMMLSAGRMLERTQYLSQVLSQAFATRAVHDDVGFETLLGVFDSTITYYAWYQHSREIADLLQLLVYNDENPRALGWLGQTLKRRLNRLQRSSKVSGQDLAALVPNLDSLPLATISQAQVDGNYPALQQLLQQYDQGMSDLAQQMAYRYFTHAGVVMHDTVRRTQEAAP